MIVPSMSNLEICNALFADLPKLKIRINTILPKIVKQLNREKKFPAWKWDEYIHQESKNRYLISFYAPSIIKANKPSVNYLAFMNDGNQTVVIQWGCWMYRKRDSLDLIATRYVGYYSGHFFSRYRERFWHNSEMSNNELICRYFSRNILTVPIELNKDIQYNCEKYGEFAKYAFQVPDGTCFVRFWNEGDETTIEKRDSNFISVVMFITFVDSGTMKPSQNKAIFKEGTRYINNYYKNLFEEAMRETFFKHLNTQINEKQ